MLVYPKWLKPDLLQIGSVRVRWYGVMYLLGFFIGRFLGRYLCRIKYTKMRQELMDDFLIYLFVGMLLGARLVYMLVYYEASPDAPFQWYTPFAVWEGGLAFHGAVFGMFLACVMFGKAHKIPFWNLTDTLALAGGARYYLGAPRKLYQFRVGRQTNQRLLCNAVSGPGFRR